MAGRYGLDGKDGDLHDLVAEFGGFDQIPVDDGRYLAYVQRDAEVAAGLLDRIGLGGYARREMRAMSRLAGAITGTGFQVDVDLLLARVAEGQEKLAAGLAVLANKYGRPTTRAVGKPSIAPHRTAEGKAAILGAFRDLGPDPARWSGPMLTDKGSPSLSKIAMGVLVERAAPEIAELARVVLSLNGVRTVYGTILDNLHGDRVHPTIVPIQASGRFSLWDPGLTVVSRRGGKHVERDVLIADDGCVLVAFDLNQIDARAVAVHSQDAAYLDLFKPGIDSRTEVALALWGDPSKREQAKAIAHGWNYGEGIAKLVTNTGLPEETVREFDAGMRERFPRLVGWRNEMCEMGQAGDMLDNGFGRRLKVDPEFAYTKAAAYMGQSTARDLMVEGVLRLPLDVVRMVRAFVHDEIVLSVPVAEVEETTAAVLGALTFTWAPPGASRTVEITAGASRAAASWGRRYAK